MVVSPADGGREAPEDEKSGDGPCDAGEQREPKRKATGEVRDKDHADEQVPRVAQKQDDKDNKPGLRRAAGIIW